MNVNECKPLVTATEENILKIERPSLNIFNPSHLCAKCLTISISAVGVMDRVPD